jgi:hypothetical protein
MGEGEPPPVTVSLSPVTFHVRDDEAVGSGRRAQYRFYLLPDTRLLRITLAWTDPPRTDARIANNLHLRVVPPGGAGQEYHGNTWRRRRMLT